MSVINRVVVTTDSNGVSPTGFNKADSSSMFRKVSSLFGDVAGGGRNGNMTLCHKPVAALATVTLSGGTGTNGDTLTVANTVITLVTSGADPASNQVNIGVSASAVMAQIVGLINGTTATSPDSWNGICSASQTGGVMTLTATIPGTVGNGLQLSVSSSGTKMVLTHLWGAVTAGSEGTKQTYKVGL